jgi:hypothetical protein
MNEGISPQDFTFGVLTAAKELYGEDAKYIPKWRSIKLVCVVADKIEFEGIPRG